MIFRCSWPTGCWTQDFNNFWYKYSWQLAIK